MTNNFTLDVDLSYLTGDERRIIDDVLRRQQEEEERNALILRGLQKDYDRIAVAVRDRITFDTSTSKKSDSNTVAIPNGSSNCFMGISLMETASMCQICRTHIPDIPIEGIRIAHCHHCGLRVCYRCGTTSTHKSRTVWTCALCRKRHELLVKSGKWAVAANEYDAGYTAAASERAHLRSRSQEPRSLVVTRPESVSRNLHGQVVPLPGQPLDLRRHISSSTAQLDSCGTDANWASDVIAQPQHRYSPKFQSESPALNMNVTPDDRAFTLERYRPSSTVSFNHHTAGFLGNVTTAERASSTLPRQSSMRPAQSLPRLELGPVHWPASFQLSRLIDNQTASQMPHNYSEAGLSTSRFVHDRTSCNISNTNANTVLVANGRTESTSSIPYQPASSTPVFSVGRSALRRAKLAAMGHQDSLSSDPSSDFGGGMAHSSSSTSYINASPNIPPLSMCRVHKSRSSLSHRRSYFAQFPHSSISSSEDDMRSTPDYSSESDMEFEVESGSVSERCELDSYRSGCESAGEGWRQGGRLVPSAGSIPLGAMTGSGVLDPLTCGSFQSTTARGSPSHGSSRPKAVRFQRGHSVDNAVPGARDSGLETASSTQTLNEDGSKFRMDWQKSLDGSKLIGKFSILRNNRGESSSRILGLKVVGGRLIENGQLGAVVTKVKRGSVADTVGRLRAGDEVVEWNGVPLVGMSFEQVCEVIGSSRDTRRLDVLVHRHLLSGLPDHPERLDSRSSRGRRHSVAFNPSMQQLSAQISQPETDLDAGRLQLKLWIDAVRSELAVTVVSARDLLLVSGAESPPQAFCVITMLPAGSWPDNSAHQQKGTPIRRWTNRHPASWEPRWEQSFTMWPVADAAGVAIDAAVYDGRSESESSFAQCVGFVNLQLSEIPLNNEPYWYRLARPEAGSRNGPGMVPPLMVVEGAQAADQPTAVVKQDRLDSWQKALPGTTAAEVVTVISSSITTVNQSSVVAPAPQPQQPQQWQQQQETYQPQQQWQQPQEAYPQQQQPQPQQQQQWQQPQETYPQQLQQQQQWQQPQETYPQQPLPPPQQPLQQQQWQQPQETYSQQQQWQQPQAYPQQTQQQQWQQPQDTYLPQEQQWQQPQVQYQQQPQQQQFVQPEMPQPQVPPVVQPPPVSHPQQQQFGQQSYQTPQNYVPQSVMPTQQIVPVTTAAQPAVSWPDQWQQQQFVAPASQAAPAFSQPTTSTPLPVTSAPVTYSQTQQVAPPVSRQFDYNVNQPTTTQSYMAPVTMQQQSLAPALTGFTQTPVDKPKPVESIQPVVPAAPLEPKPPPPITPAVSIVSGVNGPLPPTTKSEPTKSILHHPSSGSGSALAASAGESEPETGDEGHLYRKHNQIGISSTPSSSLIRRVARVRSTEVSAVNGSIATTDSNGSTKPPPLDFVDQQLPSSSLSQPMTPPPDTEKVKRHVRLAPEVSFIMGNDEPPISLPLAQDPSASPIPTPDRELTEPVVPGDSDSKSVRSSSTISRTTSAVDSVTSDAESALSGNEGTSDGDSTRGSVTMRSRMSFSESEAAAGYSSGGEPGGAHSDSNDPAVLQARLQKGSLWGKAAKKFTSKKAFPSVVDSVIAQNAKSKKKPGINRCGDEVVMPSKPMGGGMDMSAGFFDGDLGPGQVAARQMLGATAIGELELGLREESEQLTITLVAARDLILKNKSTPAIYAKAALVVGQSTQERHKSVPQPLRDCDPQLAMEFPFQTVPFRDKMLQLSLWVAYGKMSGRHCVGAVAVKLDEINQFPLRAWYKLYDPAAVGGFVASIATEGPAVGLI